MESLSLVIVVANTITLLAGGAVTGLAYRAYRRTGSPALRALTIGLGLVTLGTLVAGSAHQIGEVKLLTGVAIQSIFTALGFIVLVYSIYATHSGVRSPQ